MTDVALTPHVAVGCQRLDSIEPLRHGFSDAATTRQSLALHRRALF